MHGTDRPTSPFLAKSSGPVVAVILANIALAFGPLFVRLADVGPVAAAFWRMGLAAPILLAASFLLRERVFTASRGLWGVILLSGIAFAMDLGSWHFGIVRTTLANSTLFGNATSLIYPIYGFLIARAWPTRMQAVALLLAAAGGGLLMARSAELSSAHLVGDLFCLFAGVMYAAYFIAMTRVRARMRPISALALSSIATLAPLLLLSILLGERILPGDWTPLILLALCSQLVGQGLMIYAIAHLSPLVIGLALLVQPMVAAAVGWLWFGERLGTGDIVGALLIAAALVLVRRPARKPALAPDTTDPRSVA